MSRRALAPFLAAGIAVLPGRAEAPIESVRRAELAFARMADERGIRPAFLAWLAEDALVFTPRMIGGRDHYGKEPADGGHLAWYPEAMGIAASGELAWSLGPWGYAAGKGKEPLVHGHFLSVWRRRSGAWKVAADIGVPHGAPARSIGPFVPQAAAGKPLSASNALPELRRKEALLAAAWAEKGGAALVPDLAKDARLLRRGSQPLRGEGVAQVLEAEPPARWEPARVEAASSGDLGWTCGELLPPNGPGASFLRVWIREEGVWKVLFDVRVPHQP
ncbi:nuclear transport factor 2 family protein [Geothrix sp. 21YS21S-4]|uniref:YybH family protein n=1 Tax=Geothrix sp. 21YS21S-4 TaxID=3068889 RepID=UPI0027BA2DFD|nr:nuclear transport factor 2 family protein [Geothrix sp. 21YS21S-4]